MNWFLKAMGRYGEFSGRARRSEYWYFYLFSLLIVISATVVDRVIGTYNAEHQVGLLSGLAGLAMFLPYLAVAVRRLHDTNRSGWWLLFGLIPFLGAVTLLVFFVINSDDGLNDYGPNPKEAAV